MPSTSVTASAQPPEQSVELWKIICGTSPTHPREEERDTWGPSMDMSMQPESPNQALLFTDPNAVPVHPVSEPACIFITGEPSSQASFWLLSPAVHRAPKTQERVRHAR
jgi:hypothetical protein